MPDTYPGGVTAEQYVAVLREAAKLVCDHCRTGVPRRPLIGSGMGHYDPWMDAPEQCIAERIFANITVASARAS